MPTTLSAEEFAKQYGRASGSPATLSADEFVKRYGLNRNAAPGQPGIHLAGIAAGTDVPHGAMQPAASETVNTSAGPVTPGGAQPGFIDRLGGAAHGAAQFIEDASSMDPLRMAGQAVNLVAGNAKEGERAVAAAQRPGVGPKIEAAGHALASALPGGPAVAQPAEDFAAGNLPGAAGGLAALAAPEVAARVLPVAARAAGRAADAAGGAMSEAGVRVGQGLKPAGLSPEQAAAFDSFVREHLANGGKLGDLHAQLQAAADEAGQPAPIPDAKLPNVWRGGAKAPIQSMADANEAAAAGQEKAATLQDLADNIGAWASKPGLLERADAAISKVPIVGKPLAAATGLSTVADVAKLARDFSKGGSIRKWGANTLSSWGKALRSGDAGGLAKAASEGDQAAAGINDPAYGAVSHLGTDDLHAIYKGAPFLYVSPDGKVHQLTMETQP